MKQVLIYFLLATITTEANAKGMRSIPEPVPKLDEKTSWEGTKNSLKGIKNRKTVQEFRGRFGTNGEQTAQPYLKGNVIDSRMILQCLIDQDEIEERMGTPAMYWNLSSNVTSSLSCVKNSCEEVGGKAEEVHLFLNCSNVYQEMTCLPLCRVDSCVISDYIKYLNDNSTAFWGESTRGEYCSYDLKAARSHQSGLGNIWGAWVYLAATLALIGSCVKKSLRRRQVANFGS